MFELREIIKATQAKLVTRSNQDYVSNVCLDSRTIRKGEIFFALKGNNFDGHDFIKDAIHKGAYAVVISSEFKDMNAFSNFGNDSISTGSKAREINILKVKDTTAALGHLAKYHRKKYNIPLIAITGSTGKTTTKDIVAEILSTQFKVLKNFGTYNNHIGVPQTILKLNSKHNICILELGTNHFGEISYLSSLIRPQIAVITNIGAAHLEFFKDIKGVFKEKTSIANHLFGPKIILLNRDDILLKKIKLTKEFKIFYFGINETADFMASDISLGKNRVNFVFNKKHRFSLNTLGRFNIYNALAGIGCGLLFGVSIKKMKEALYNFNFPQQRLKKIDCTKFIILDDTYNSNPLSLKQAIESLIEFKTKGRRILVMGDMLELGSSSADFHREIGNFISQRPIDILITLGNLSKFTAEELKSQAKDNRQIFSFDSKQELTYFLKNKLKRDDTLLIKGSRLLKMEEIASSLSHNAL